MVVPSMGAALALITLAAAVVAQVPEGLPEPPSTSCEAATVNAFSESCVTEKEGAFWYPYCRQVTTGVSPQFECRECVSQCDCDLGMYCSREPGEVGQCRKFAMEGKPCRPMNASQLTSSDIDDEWKCADVYSESSTLFINHQGSCINEVCKFCSPGTRFNDICSPSTGIKVERACVYPGVAVDRHGLNWAAGVYHFQPLVVWSTIFFCFFVLILFCQAVRTFFLFKS
jgi:hypothetical protein